MRGRIFWGVAFLLAATGIAQAQQGAASTNGYTAAQRAKVEAAVRAAGYTPTLLADVQGGHAFFFATKDGKPSRVRFEIKDGKKIRVAVKTGETING